MSELIRNTTYSGRGTSVVHILKSLLTRWHVFISARSQRRALLTLDDHLLRDVGINRPQAEAEARRLAWRGLTLES
ncbi:MAG: DUF1127 domain-containing protein [Pseudomonadota bacterium]